MPGRRSRQEEPIRTIEVATETEDAAKVAKETVYGSNSQQVHKVKSFQKGSKKATNRPNENAIDAENINIWHPIAGSKRQHAISARFKVI